MENRAHSVVLDGSASEYFTRSLDVLLGEALAREQATGRVVGACVDAHVAAGAGRHREKGRCAEEQSAERSDVPPERTTRTCCAEFHGGVSSGLKDASLQMGTSARIPVVSQARLRSTMHCRNAPR